MGEPQISVHLGRPALDACPDKTDEILAEVGLSRETFQEVTKRVETPRVFRIWELAAKHDPSVGFRAGAERDAICGEIVSYMARNSPTLGVAFRRIGKFASLLDDSSVLDIESCASDLCLRFSRLAGLTAPPIAFQEYVVSTLLSFASATTGTSVRARSVRFAYAAPAHLELYEKHLGASCSFDHRATELVFPAEVADLPILGGDIALGDYLEAYARQNLLADDRSLFFERRLRDGIISELPHGATLERVAKRIGMSARTLQRRLSDKNLQFGAIADEVRRERAIEWVERSPARVTEIAAAVGYSDVQSFREAFVRWTGSTPSAYRRSNNVEGHVESAPDSALTKHVEVKSGVFGSDIVAKVRANQS